MFTIRTNKPQTGNKYYIRQVTGGWNGAIQGKPLDAECNVLANCVGYANGRFAEIQDTEGIKYQLVCNAENFIEKAKAYGLEVIDKPTLGGIMCWQKGASLNGTDGPGHVAIVEKIIDDNTIYTSESAYGSFAFANITRTNSNGRWGCNSNYKFRGCIVNPAVGIVTETESNDDTERKSNDEIAREVIEGKWGVGLDRKRRLEDAGYNYNDIQTLVNQMLGYTQKKEYKTVTARTGLNIREYASLSSKIIGAVAYGKEIQVLENDVIIADNFHWDKIQYGNIIGYVANTYLR